MVFLSELFRKTYLKKMVCRNRYLKSNAQGSRRAQKVINEEMKVRWGRVEIVILFVFLSLPSSRGEMLNSFHPAARPKGTPKKRLAISTRRTENIFSNPQKANEKSRCFSITWPILHESKRKTQTQKNAQSVTHQIFRRFHFKGS